jgi:hypothetical protein
VAFVHQSLTIVASMLELGLTIGFIGNDADRAAAWMTDDGNN